MEASIYDIPNEILVHIIAFLRFREILAFAQTCSLLHDIVLHDRTLSSICGQRFGVYHKRNSEENWGQLCFRLGPN